jgi:hypothetical protein
MDVLDRLEKVRKQRKRIRDAKLRDDVDWETVDPEITEAFDEVARAFDIVAALDRMGITDRKFVDRFFASAFHELWTECGLDSYVRWVQSRRGGTHLWELAQFDARARRAAESHPDHPRRGGGQPQPWGDRWGPALPRPVRTLIDSFCEKRRTV